MSRPRPGRTIPAVFSDADNTLWDTDAVYRRAHAWLFSEATKVAMLDHMADPVGFVRSIDQELAESHPAHLRYPAFLLVSELFRRLLPENARPTESITEEIAREFIKMTGEPPMLRPGVKEGLERLVQLKCPVRVITETSVERCTRLLLQHEIANYVESVESMTKDEECFRLLSRRLPADALPWMVGDQLTRDILPARSAGFRTLYFPGAFLPRWENSVTQDSETIQITTFASVPTIIENSLGNDQFSSTVAQSR